jgi:pyruvate dehydrogenase E2 component (dihydrolipoamide acetyltransferase)
MAKIIGLPKLSPTMDEGTLAKWHKKEGDAVEVDELLADVETDKATMEFRSFDRGVILKIMAPEGSVLAPDAPVMIVGKAGEDISGLGGGAAKAPAAKAAGPVDAPIASDSTNGSVKDLAFSASAPAAEEGSGLTAHDRPERGGKPRSTQEPSAANARVLASPLVRRLAREHDVDLHGVEGSGPHGRIVKKDLDAALSSAGDVAAPKTAPVARSAFGVRRETRIEKLSQMRKVIARRLTESKQTVPHFYLTIDVDAAPLSEARVAINESLAKSGEKISLNDLLIKACAIALRRYPAVNASFMGEAIHYHGNVDISVAVAIEGGLVTPVVRSADEKGVLDIAREVRELAGRAKEKKLKPEEMTNGTFSISNLGMYDIESFSAVINPPEGAILAVGSVREEPVVKDGAIAAGKRLRLTLSCDHRVIDGATGAEWLRILKGLLEKPLTMIV